MENKSKLPKYWVVKNDGSQRFKDEVIAYMKRIAPASNWVGDSVGYYGVDGTIKEFSTGTSNGTDSHELLRDFINNPVVLTINEFIDLKNGEELKIIRYKLKKPELRRAVAELLNGIIRFNGSGYRTNHKRWNRRVHNSGSNRPWAQCDSLSGLGTGKSDPPFKCYLPRTIQFVENYFFSTLDCSFCLSVCLIKPTEMGFFSSR